jgi:trans-2,3-dihydro-3-hydroxyanthranilate isomerase
MRIFTPTGELPFAGHPSLGTAWTLGANQWTQRTAGATVTVEADEHGAVMTQPDPSFEVVDPPPFVPGTAQAWVAMTAGTRQLLTLTDAPIDRFQPDLQAVAELNRATKTNMFGLVRRLDAANLHVRVFVPLMGIPEDPGTGAAAGPIGVLARQHWATNADLVIHQGAEVGRPCRIDVHAELGKIRVGGRVVQCAKGHFSLY